MQPSQASNETRLPRAVLRRSAAINERLAAKAAESEPHPADPNAPPASPSATAANPADPDPAPPAPTPSADPRENDPAYWKQRFNVTAGVLRTEREARQADATRFDQRLSELQNQILALQASAPAAAIELGSYLTPEQIETLGEEEATAVAEAARKAAREAVQAAIEVEIKPLRDQHAANQTANAEARKQQFVERLLELVPDFQVIDVMPEWADHDTGWLAEEDETTGVQRQKLMDEYVWKGDAKRVAALFNTFKASRQMPQPPVVPHGSGAPYGGDPPPVSAKGLKPLTPTEIRDFFKRAALGKRAHPPVTDAERTEFEARRKLTPGR